MATTGSQPGGELHQFMCEQCGEWFVRARHLATHEFSWRCLWNQLPRSDMLAVCDRNCWRDMSRRKAFRSFLAYLRHNVELQTHEYRHAIACPFVPVSIGGGRERARVQRCTYDIAYMRSIAEGLMRREGLQRGSPLWQERALAASMVYALGFAARWAALVGLPPLLHRCSTRRETEEVWARYADALETGMLNCRNRGLPFVNLSITGLRAKSIGGANEFEARRKARQLLSTARAVLERIPHAIEKEGQAVKWKVAHAMSGIGLPKAGYSLGLGETIAWSLGYFEGCPHAPGEPMLHSRSDTSGVIKAIAAITGESALRLKNSPVLTRAWTARIGTVLSSAWRQQGPPGPQRPDFNDVPNVVSQLCQWHKTGQPDAIDIMKTKTANGAGKKYRPPGVRGLSSFAGWSRPEVDAAAAASLREARGLKRKRRGE